MVEVDEAPAAQAVCRARCGIVTEAAPGEYSWIRTTKRRRGRAGALVTCTAPERFRPGVAVYFDRVARVHLRDCLLVRGDNRRVVRVFHPVLPVAERAILGVQRYLHDTCGDNEGIRLSAER